MSLEQNVWTLGKATEYLESEKGIQIKTVTLRSWFNDLERLKVHTLPRTDNKRERVLTQLEIEIAIFIHSYKVRYGRKVSQEIIAQAVKETFDTRLNFFEQEDGTGESHELLSVESIIGQLRADFNERLEEMEVRIEERLEEKIRQEYEDRDREAKLALPDPSVQAEEERVRIRSIQLDLWEMDSRIKRELRSEAEVKWNENPIKTGFLIKKEDAAKKNEFILKYIDDHLIERRRSELEK